MIKATKPDDCSLYKTLGIIKGKWKPLILYHLKNDTQRYNALHRLIVSVSPRILTLQLRELEKHKLIRRHIYTEVPPRVEYSLTKLGKSLIPILENLAEWRKYYNIDSDNAEPNNLVSRLKEK